MKIFNINLSTKIILSFTLIGVLFIGMVLFSFINGKQVIAGLTLINNESAPVINYSSKTNELVNATEPLILKLLSSHTPNEYQQTARDPKWVSLDVGEIHTRGRGVFPDAFLACVLSKVPSTLGLCTVLAVS